jgi:hypothetical protein
MQGIELVYRDWRPANMVYNNMRKLFMLLDFGMVQSMKAGAPFVNGGTPGTYIELRKVSIPGPYYAATPNASG